MSRILAAAVAGAVVLTLASCGGGGAGAGEAAGACAAPHKDLLDVRSTLHLLPGAPEPPYSTDPPTSGAHRVGYYPRGVVGAPIARGVQVGLLEKGFVVVQYRSTLGPNAASALASLTTLSPYVAVAPDPTLPDPVVATSWLHDLRCGGTGPAAVAAIARFVAQRVGRGTEPTIPVSRTSPGGITTTTTP